MRTFGDRPVVSFVLWCVEWVCCRARVFHVSERTDTLQSVNRELSAYFGGNLNVHCLISDCQFVLSSVGQSFVFFSLFSQFDFSFKSSPETYFLSFFFFVLFLKKFLIAAFSMIYEWKSSDYASSAPSDTLEEHKRERRAGALHFPQSK